MKKRNIILLIALAVVVAASLLIMYFIKVEQSKNHRCYHMSDYSFFAPEYRQQRLDCAFTHMADTGCTLLFTADEREYYFGNRSYGLENGSNRY